MQGIRRIGSQVRSQRGVGIVVLVTVYQTELAERDEETPASVGMDVEVSGQLVGRGRSTAEHIEKAEINGSKEDL
jgi:hypothetical protein